MKSAQKHGVAHKMAKTRAKNNRTIFLTDEERVRLSKSILSSDFIFNSLLKEKSQVCASDILDKTIQGDTISLLRYLPDEFADLIIIDPPYNLTKDFAGVTFNARSSQAYDEYLASWFPAVCKKLKPSGSLYMCGDWKCTSALQRAIEAELTILNRITWQREKGRGSAQNWKNSMEDIWFAVKDAKNYFFNAEAVKQKRRVLAPYRENGVPKDWQAEEGGKFRLTGASNFWDDISIPFWSMSENTEHPTQQSEKLYAKLILASSAAGDVVFDPFLGSGTASVVAKKLGRHFCGIEQSAEYCLLAQKRLEMAESDKSIQGYADGVFWERNSRQSLS